MPMLQVNEVKKIFEEVDYTEYQKLQDQRNNDDFIVDDDGYGYRDHGGEIWETDDQEDEGGKKKKRKIDVNKIALISYF